MLSPPPSHVDRGATTHGLALDESAAANNPTLATFGIVLTGRLGLRNDLLSTFSVGKDVWDEYAATPPSSL